MKEEGFDICYGCSKVFPYGVLFEENPIDFDIYCPKCRPNLYNKKEAKEVMKQEIK